MTPRWPLFLAFTLAGLPLAFFTLNGIVSLVLGASGIADVIW